MSTERKTPLPVRETYFVPDSIARMLASLCQQSGSPHDLAIVAGTSTLAIEVGGSYIIDVRGGNWADDTRATDDEIKRLIENCSRPVEGAMTTDYPPLDLAEFEGHTPGPWAVLPRLAGSGRVHVGPVLGSSVAELFDIDAWRANSHLIAAAPQLLRERCELLEALNSIIRIADHLSSPGGHCYSREEYEADIESARALSARIEGAQ